MPSYNTINTAISKLTTLLEDFNLGNHLYLNYDYNNNYQCREAIGMRTGNGKRGINKCWPNLNTKLAHYN